MDGCTTTSSCDKSRPRARRAQFPLSAIIQLRATPRNDALGNKSVLRVRAVRISTLHLTLPLQMPRGYILKTATTPFQTH
uniref:Uncharacterized protein n=1 Tax=Panagrellus redivivus TaxID=6233 RepID=A0A7E4WC67_PANRE